MSKIFTHIKTDNLYRVLGSARCAKNPMKTKIIYEQLYVRGTGEDLPIHSLWMRNPNDFQKKFVETTVSDSDIDAYRAPFPVPAPASVPVSVSASVPISKQKQKQQKQKEKEKGKEKEKSSDIMHNTNIVTELVSEVGQAVLQTAQVMTDVGSKVVKKAKKIVSDIDGINP